MRDVASRHGEAPTDTPARRHAYEEVIGCINAVLADFADGQAIEWYEMFDAIKGLLADHQVDLASGDFAIPVTAPLSGGEGPRVLWNADLEIGRDWVDHQHRAMVAMLNEIGQLPAGYDPSDTDALLERLRRATWHHFHEEEAHLSACPEAAQHIAAHRRLLAVLDRLMFDVRAHRVDLPTVARNVLCDWLVDHILTLDRRDFGGISPRSDTD